MNKWLRISSLVVALSVQLSAQSVRTNAGFNQKNIPRNDDGSSQLVPLGFTINFFGRTRASGYVNNNGNITFDSPLATYTPFGLDGTKREIIAPFFADVDTRSPLSKLVTYGNDVVNGHNAFGINYLSVGYFSSHADKLNSFQLVLIDRSDLGAGNFDVEFNYDRITWETGDASGGVNGLGPVSASAGWSNGTGLAGTSFQLPGSLVPGAFLDGGPQSLARRRQYSNLAGVPAGRFTFRARDGILLQGLGITTGSILGPVTLGLPFVFPLQATGGTTYRWNLLNDPGNSLPWLNLTPSGALSGTPPVAGSYEFTVTTSSRIEDIDFTDSRRITLIASPPALQIDQRSCPLPLGTAKVPYSARLNASGGSGPYSWSWGATAAVPGLTLSDGGVISGTPTWAGNFLFTLRVAGSKPELAEPGTRQCTLIVQPAFAEPSIVSCPVTAATAGVPLAEILRGGGGAAPYFWSASGILPNGLSLTSAGQLSGIPEVNGTFPFQIFMRDANGRNVSKNCAIAVTSPVLNLSTACPLAEGVTGGVYSQPLTVSGGRAPYTWSTLGSFPVGLIPGNNGSISGRPNDAGAFQFRLNVEDSDGLKASKNCSLIVQRANLSINSCPLPPAKQGVLYQRALGVVGGSGIFSWSASGKTPRGLNLAEGIVFGIPAEAGAFEFQLQVRDSGGLAASQQCQLYVEPVALEITSACPESTTNLGANFPHQSTARGGLPPYKWTVDGTLPDGLRLNADGSISGAANKIGDYSFDLVVADARAQELRENCVISTKLPGLPQLRLSVASPVVAPASSLIPVTVDLPVYPLAMQADFVLANTVDAGNGTGEVNQPDPVVRFTGGQKTTSITIPAGTRRATISIASSGTVAGQTTIQVSKLRVLGADLPFVPPPASFRVDRSIPVLTDACYRPDGTDLQVEVTGYSTTRSLTGANLAINGKTLRTIDIGSIANDYFTSELSIRTGGAFTVFVPLATPNPITVDSLTVALTNRIGTSQTRTVRRCQ